MRLAAEYDLPPLIAPLEELLRNKKPWRNVGRSISRIDEQQRFALGKKMNLEGITGYVTRWLQLQVDS